MQNADCGIRKGEKSLVFYSEIRIPKSELEFSLCLRLPETTCLEIPNTTVDRGASNPDILFDKIYI